MADLEVSARLRALQNNGKPFTELHQVALGSECGSVGTSRGEELGSRRPITRTGTAAGEGLTDNLIESQLNGKESILISLNKRTFIL